MYFLLEFLFHNNKCINWRMTLYTIIRIENYDSERRSILRAKINRKCRNENFWYEVSFFRKFTLWNSMREHLRSFGRTYLFVFVPITRKIIRRNYRNDKRLYIVIYEWWHCLKLWIQREETSPIVSLSSARSWNFNN